MAQEPVIYARLNGDILEVATDRLAWRSETGTLIAVEDHVRLVCARVGEVRVMTLDEAPWGLADHVIAPPLQRVATQPSGSTAQFDPN